MTYDYFIAGRYRNKENVLDLTQRIRATGKTAYCFADGSSVDTMSENTEEAMHTFEHIPDWRNDSTVRKIFETDMEAQRSADTFILLLPAGKSGHIEAGVAYGLGKKCIMIGEQKEAESLYLIFQEHYPTIDEFIASISR